MSGNIRVVYSGQDPDYLAHYGVLGMKWGVRKDGKPQGFQYGKARVRIRSKKTEIKNRAKTNLDRTHANRNRSQLSDAELERRINRLKKEKELRQLTESEVKPGRTFVKDFIKDNGRKIAGSIAVGAGTYFVLQMMKHEPGNLADAADLAKKLLLKKK